MKSQQEWSTFAADYRLGESPLRACRNVWQDLSGHSWQIWMIFRSGFSATFRKTALGLVWGLIMPLVPLFAFFALTLLRVFPAHELIHPLSYMATGVTLWLFFLGLMTAPGRAVTTRASVLKHSDFPLIGEFMASYGTQCFELLVRMLVILPVLLIYSDLNAKALLTGVACLVPATAFCVSMGIIIGLAGIAIPDSRNVIEIVLRYLVFVSFAIFPLPLSGIGGWLYALNPVAIFIDNIRSAVILGDLSTPLHFYVTSGFSVFLLLIVLHVYNMLERRVAGAL